MVQVWQMTTAAIVLVSSAATAAPWEPASRKAKEQLAAAAVLFGAGEFAAAAAGYEAANRIAPSNKAVWNAAQSHGAAGDWPRALALLDQLLADPELPREHLARVSARRKLAAAFVAAARLSTEARFEEARTAYEAIAADTSVGPMDRAQASKALEALEVQRKAISAMILKLWREHGRDLTIIVAAVLAGSEEEAWAEVLGAFDEPRSDSDIKRRFCDEQPLGAMVADSIFGDRWPKAEWMAWSPQDGITCACGCERSAR